MGSRGPKPGTTGRPKADIARIAIAAHLAGERMSTAVARHYGCSDRAAAAAISRARLAGHPIPSDRPLAHGAYRNPHGTVAAFLRHVNAGEAPCAECEPMREVHRRRHAEYVRRRRHARMKIAPMPERPAPPVLPQIDTVAALAAGRPPVQVVAAPEPLRFVPPPPAPGGPCLTCDCGHTVYLAEHMPGDRMLRHTISEHGRRPHAHERTPREARKAAA